MELSLSITEDVLSDVSYTTESNKGRRSVIGNKLLRLASNTESMYRNSKKIESEITKALRPVSEQLNETLASLKNREVSVKEGFIPDKYLKSLFLKSGDESVADNIHNHAIMMLRLNDEDKFEECIRIFDNYRLTTKESAYDMLSKVAHVLLTELNLDVRAPYKEGFIQYSLADLGTETLNVITNVNNEFGKEYEYITGSKLMLRSNDVRHSRRLTRTELIASIEKTIITIDDIVKNVRQFEDIPEAFFEGYSIALSNVDDKIEVEFDKIKNSSLLETMGFSSDDRKEIIRAMSGFTIVAYHTIFTWLTMVDSSNSYIGYVNDHLE